MDAVHASTRQGSGSIRLERGSLTDASLLSVLTLVAQHPPFRRYAFGLMVGSLTEQLRHGASVLAFRDGQLLAYAGWLRVEKEQAARWQRGEAGLPEPNWGLQSAAIINTTVTTDVRLLAPLLRAVSHVCDGIEVYRMRSFQDGRPDMRRPPITGRRHAFA
ncbi:MAG: hypothetical protein EOO28_02225 [Comamonadaceae bacterium]|nr:MAG: hypothetical protein EOO28_02225 [Comamonadaceae bacterium]